MEIVAFDMGIFHGPRPAVAPWLEDSHWLCQFIGTRGHPQEPEEAGSVAVWNGLPTGRAVQEFFTKQMIKLVVL